SALRFAISARVLSLMSALLIGWLAIRMASYRFQRAASFRAQVRAAASRPAGSFIHPSAFQVFAVSRASAASVAIWARACCRLRLGKGAGAQPGRDSLTNLQGTAEKRRGEKRIGARRPL